MKCNNSRIIEIETKYKTIFFIAIFLELTHLFIPERGFEIKDLYGNFAGVAISLIIFLIFKLRKKNEF